MARHAGFAVAATVGEAFINQTIRAAFEDLEPVRDSLLFSLPQSVPVGGGSVVRLSGVALFEQRPKVTLRTNPSNTARMQTAAVVYVAANIDSPAGPSFDQTWKLRVSGSAAVAIDVEVAEDGVFLRWQPGGSSVGELSVELLEGPSVSEWLVRALNSPEMLAAMNQALRAVGPVRVSEKLISRRISHVQEMKIEKAHLSAFEWFRIDETIGSRVAVRVMDGCVSVGIDLEGRTSGDPGQLVDLRNHAGDSVTYRASTFDHTVNDQPILVAASPVTDSDLSVLVNADVIAAITHSISTQIAGSPISPAAKIASLSARIEHFEKPLRGREMGMRVDFVLDHKDAGAIDGHLYLQPYLSEQGRAGPESRPGVWMMSIGLVELDVPWWMEAIAVVGGVAIAAMLPALSPLVFVGVLAALQGVGGVISDGGHEIAEQLGGGVAIGVAAKSSTLPTKKQQSSWENLNRITLGSDGVGAQMSIIAASVRFDESNETVDTASVGTQFATDSVGNFRAWVELRPDLLALQDECTVQLIVHRADTREEVGRSEGPYRQHRSVAFSHLTEDLYFVDAFLITARIWVNRASMSGLLFASETEVPVVGAIERRRPFLTWEAHWAHFRNQGTQMEWWHRFSQPKLHRTAASSQCLAIRQRVERFARLGKPPFVGYVDKLPFEWGELAAHRDELCDFCFFGGPTLTLPYPRQDWFCKTIQWPTLLLESRGTEHEGEEPLNLLGPPDGRYHPVWSGGSVSFLEFKTVAGLDIAELLKPERTTHGDQVSRQDLGRTDVVAFARSGSVPAGGGGLRSCDWSFDDESSPTLQVHWDGDAGAPRDPRVVASGSIRGADYATHFGIASTAPGGQIPPDEVISYLLFDLSSINVEERMTIGLSVPPPPDPDGPESLVAIDAVALLRR